MTSLSPEIPSTKQRWENHGSLPDYKSWELVPGNREKGSRRSTYALGKFVPRSCILYPLG